MLTEGMIIADRYEIIGKVGAGGMSDVYKAKDLTLGRFVAIKVLKPEFSEDLNFVTKFRTEAQSAAGLEHPNIVNIYDVGSEKGMHYIVMEYIEGITLKTYIEKKGQLSFKEAVSIAIQVGRGIEAAHNKNIIHRDIKPQNIIISTEGKVKVTDFGIAKAASANTISSDVMGSVHYSSPEQARNGFVDGKSDIYSLGIVMYEMVTGRVPFDGDTTVAVAIQHLQEEMVPPSAYAPDLPISMEKIILKCTQKNSDRRYESMTALLSDLRKALVSPNEDFVVMVSAASQDKTRIIGADDLKQIKQEAGSVYLKADEAVHSHVEEKYEDEDDEDDELDDEDDGEMNPKMEKAITIMGIAAAVVIVIIIIVLVVNLFGGVGKRGNKDTETQRTETQTTETQQSEKIKVPKVLGMTFDEAKAELEKYGLKIENKGEVSSDNYEEGEIANQDPLEGNEVKEGDTIGVVISNGKGSVDVPGVTGKSEDDAVEALEKAGFKPNKTYSYSDTVKEDYVISQTPSSGSKGKEGDTITIEISKGAQAVTVPDVTNNYKSEEQAKIELSAAGLSVTTKSAYHDEIPAGIVIGQSIDAGKQVEKGTTITITVSQGPTPSQNVTASTYKCNVTMRLRAGEATNAATASAVLKDASGNVIAQWGGQSFTSDESGNRTVNFSQGGLLVSSGKLEVTYLDASGTPIGEPQMVDVSVSSGAFTPET